MRTLILAFALLVASPAWAQSIRQPVPVGAGDPRTPWPTWSHDNANAYTNGGTAIYDLKQALAAAWAEWGRGVRDLPGDLEAQR